MSCSPNSAKECYKEGQSRLHKLTNELKGVETYSDFVARQSRIEKQIERLVDLMILAAEFPDEQMPRSEESERLAREIERIYQIGGVKALMEESQKNGLRRLSKVYTLK
ncbi:MAG: hypothetical protein MRY21_05760 [Simkaniaceae bacterium]|nr:hypothetical protein [Simkaniaceae bacterium]